MRRSPVIILLLLLALVPAAAPAARADTPAPTPTEPAADLVPSAAAQRITVAYGDVLSTIEHPFWGVNYVAFWDAAEGSAKSRQALKNAGVQVIRFPGGEPANWLDWSRPVGPPYWTSTTTDDLWAYAQGVGAQLMLQTNPTDNTINNNGDRNNPAAEHAAGGWAAYTRSRGIAAPYWEVGNEPDIRLSNDFDWAAMQWYFDRFNEHAAAIKRADPSAKVFGPVGTNAYQWWRLHSLDMFMAKAGNRQGSGLVDGVSLHYYPQGGCAGWDNVVSVAQDWPAFMAQIRSVIAQYDTRPLPVFISETNAAVGAQNCEIGQTMASALANADLFGAYRESGVQAMQFYGGIHGSLNWGLLYGVNESRPVDTATPTYYVFPVWTRSENQVLRVSGESDPARTLSAYASRGVDGSVQVVAINKTNQPIDLTVAFDGIDPRGRVMHVYELRPETPGDVWDKDVVYNGVTMPDPSAATLPAPASATLGGATVSRTLPAYSLTLLEIEGGAAVPPGTGPSPSPAPNPNPAPGPGPQPVPPTPEPRWSSWVYIPAVRR